MNEVVEKKNTTGAWAGLILSLIYMISPLDLIPDAIPVAGWIDDLLIGGIGMLNFFQQQVQSANSSLALVAKTLKWILIVLAVVLVLLVLLFGTLIVSLFTK